MGGREEEWVGRGLSGCAGGGVGVNEVEWGEGGGAGCAAAR